jgi:hypothetical protein
MLRPPQLVVVQNWFEELKERDAGAVKEFGGLTPNSFHWKSLKRIWLFVPGISWLTL